MSSLPRRTHPSLSLPQSHLGPSDLVVRLPVPNGHPSHHYHDDRFFRQVEYLREQVGDAIYVAGTLTPQPAGSCYFSNVFALYEVEHWPNAATQAEYTIWVLETIKNVQNDQGLPMMTTTVRKVVEACLEAWNPGAYCWLHHLFPDLEDILSDRTALARVGRNPLQSLVVGCDEPFPELGQEGDFLTSTGNQECVPLDFGIDMDGALRETECIVNDESAGSMIKDPTLRKLLALAPKPHRSRRGSLLRLINVHFTGPVDEAWLPHGSYAVDIPNRPFTSAKSISPVQIDPMDLDEQDTAELDAAIANMDAGNNSKAANGGDTTATHSLDKESSPSNTAAPGIRSQPKGANSMPAYVHPHMPGTSSQQNPVASPKAPDSDSTIKLRSSSPVAPSSNQRPSAPPFGAPSGLGIVPSLLPRPATSTTPPRSPGKIPQGQKPPMTFRDAATTNKRKRADSHEQTVNSSVLSYSGPGFQQQPQAFADGLKFGTHGHGDQGTQGSLNARNPSPLSMLPPPAPGHIGAQALIFAGTSGAQASYNGLAQEQAAMRHDPGQLPIQSEVQRSPGPANQYADTAYPVFEQHVPQTWVPYQYEQGGMAGGKGQQHHQGPHQ